MVVPLCIKWLCCIFSQWLTALAKKIVTIKMKKKKN